MNFWWSKLVVFGVAISANFDLLANKPNWGQVCSDIDFETGVQQCRLSADPRRCLSAFIDTSLTDNTSVSAATRADFLNDLDAGEMTGRQAAKLWASHNHCPAYDHGTGQLNLWFDSRDGGALDLGQIPAGKAQVRVALAADFDVDWLLSAGSTLLIHKTAGLINAAEPVSAEYQGMRMDYSGHAGTGSQPGHEFIHLTGLTPAALNLQIHSQQSGPVTVDYSWGIDPSLGTLKIEDRAMFNDLSSRIDSPGAMGIREVKFMVMNIDTPRPSLYFINGNHVPLHIDFVYDVLGWYPDLSFDEAYQRFNSTTYFLDNRQHLAGSVLAHDSFVDSTTGQQGLFSLQMWPTDPVAAPLIVRSYQLIAAHMPLLANRLHYFPAGNTQQQIYAQNEAYFDANQVRTIDSESLFGNLAYAAMNLGEGYGTLKVVGEGDSAPAVSDVVIFTFIPNDLNHVAGIITDTPQTPLSHINLIARQNNTPNAFIQAAANHPDIAPLIGQLVHYQVTADGFVVEPASQAEADAWLDQVRPSEPLIPLSDLSVTEPARLDTLRHEDWISFGVKAANVAELAHVLEPGTFPVGYAIPFTVYDEFMQLNRCQGLEDDGFTPDGKYRQLCEDPNDPAGKTLYQQIQAIMAAQDFIDDPQVRAERLDDFRQDVRKAEVPETMANTLETIRLFWDPDGVFTHSIRLRSSTNNEDLEGFNGAGLYESNTHKIDEGMLAESVKKVWASLWTARAFEERRFYRIDHFKTYMGVLAHLNYGDEQVNGVAVTKNIYDRNWEGYYVNAQYGEISVTNPEPIETSDGLVGAIPDEFLLARLVASDTDFAWVQQYIRHSNVETVYGQPVPTENVLTDDEVTELRHAMQRIQAHFKAVYGGDADFAMDIEFKITATDDGSRGHLEIKQARPWVD